MKKISRALAIILSLAMTVGMASGCNKKQTGDSSNKTSGNSQTDSKDDSSGGGEGTVEKATVSLWIHEGMVANLKRWGVDETSKYIMEKTGVNFDISTGDGINDDTKVNLMISSDDLPDMLVIPKWNKSTISMQKEGLLEDIEQLAKDNNAENLLKVINEANDLNIKFNRFKDGNYWGGTDAPLYIWPDYYIDKNAYERTNDEKRIQERKAWLVRQDIYEAEGSPDLSNIDDFVAYLEKTKKYKDVNGKPITPMGLLDGASNDEAMHIVYASFHGNADEIIFENDSIKFDYTTPDFEKSLMFLNSIYSKGLLDREIYTQTYDQWRDKLIAGNIGIVPCHYWHADGANTKLKDTGMHYQALPAEKIPKEEDIEKLILNIAPAVSCGWRATVIPKTSKNKEAIMRFLNFINSHEGQMLGWYGMPGVYNEPAEAWDEASLPKLLDGSMIMKTTPAWEEAQAKFGTDAGKETGADNFWGFWCNSLYSEFKGSGANNNANSPYLKWNREQVLKTSNYDLEQRGILDLATLGTSDDATKAISDSLKMIRDKWYPKIIMAKTEKEAKTSYDTMIKECEAAGIAKLSEGYSKIYNERMLSLIKE